jgi:hypothetical protein
MLHFTEYGSVEERKKKERKRNNKNVGLGARGWHHMIAREIDVPAFTRERKKRTSSGGCLIPSNSLHSPTLSSRATKTYSSFFVSSIHYLSISRFF